VSVIPIVTPAEMNEIDRAAPEPVEVLIDRAGSAVARMALGMLGGAYGRRVSILAGPGNNGNDGRSAAAKLRSAGVRVAVVDALDDHPRLPPADLVVDAAFGTGFRGEFVAPQLDGRAHEAPVLAVDIPSGLSGLTGESSGAPMRASRTITFAALKPGLLLGSSRSHCGEVVIADIGLDTSGTRSYLVEPGDVPALFPGRSHLDHKWTSAVWVVGGSPGMPGAPWLCARGAMRAGAGYVRVSTPGVEHPGLPTEAVGTQLPASGWGSTVAAELAGDGSRFSALVVGPGLAGSAIDIASELAELGEVEIPILFDGSALPAVAEAGLEDFQNPPVLTPHDGEFSSLMGGLPGPDRFEAARNAAAELSATVLLKGPTTIVADLQGNTLVAAAGDERLATAGSGDVLAGVIAAAMAAGTAPLEAAAAGAVLHGLAGRMAGERGVVAGDVAEALPRALVGVVV
jgi:NAD(P)H-hydrate epimerase